MATFTGTNANETITPTVVTPGVTAQPTGSKPSDADDTIAARGGSDTIDSGGGNDTASGQLGNDVIHLGAGNDLAIWNVGEGSDTVDGGTGNDIADFLGTAANQNAVLSANAGRMRFTSGAETVSLDNVEQVRFAASDGTDSILINNLSGTDVTRVTIDLEGTAAVGAGDGQTDTIKIPGTGSADRINIAGSANSERTATNVTITGLAARIDITRLDPVDTLNIQLGAGDDTILVRGFAFLTPGLQLIINGGVGNDFIDGRGGGERDLTLSGGDGNDVVMGGVGRHDTALLGAGDDRVVFQGRAGSELIEGGAGTDTLEFLGHDGGSGVERFTFTAIGTRVLFGTADVNGIETAVIDARDGRSALTVGDLSGTDLVGLITFVGGEDEDAVDATAASNDMVITGGGDGDNLNGGNGNDTFIYRAGSDSVTGERASGGGGIDRLQLINTGAIDFRSATIVNLEVLQFVSGNSTATFAGDQIGDTAIGSVISSAGSDRLIVRGNTIDISDVTFLSWGASDVISLLGTADAGTITGSAQRDTINGALAGDLMIGLGGDDTYVVDHTFDIVNELGGSGIDTVQSSISFSLANTARVRGAIENLKLSDVTNINGIGNGLVNIITGNSGNNALNGGGGGDTLQGLAGNDSYIVDSTADKIIETTGTDNVSTSISYMLGAGVSVETLRTIDAAATTAINLIGNELVNIVTGNAGANIINGGAGNDKLTGKAGNDFFAFNTALNAATNVDTITDFVIANDTVRLENFVFHRLATGVLDADAFHIGGTAADAEDRIIYDSTTGALIFDSNGNVAGGSTQFAKLATGLALTNADFVVI